MGLEESDLYDWIFETTWKEKLASAAEPTNPKRWRGGRRMDARRTKEGERVEEEVCEEEDWRRENEVGVAAVDAIVGLMIQERMK